MHIRILIHDTGPHLASLLDQPGIEIRILQAPAHQTIYRYDDQLLVTLHLIAQDADQAPLLHLTRVAPGGLFDRFAEHYNDLWEQHGQPINPDLDLAPDEDDDEDESPEPDPHHPASEQPAASTGEQPSPPPPRRWPRQPERPPDHRE